MSSISSETKAAIGRSLSSAPKSYAGGPEDLGFTDSASKTDRHYCRPLLPDHFTADMPTDKIQLILDCKYRAILLGKMVGVGGFEPPASSFRTKRANRAAPHPAKSRKHSYLAGFFQIRRACGRPEAQPPPLPSS